MALAECKGDRPSNCLPVLLAQGVVDVGGGDGGFGGGDGDLVEAAYDVAGGVKAGDAGLLMKVSPIL